MVIDGSHGWATGLRDAVEDEVPECNRIIFHNQEKIYVDLNTDARDFEFCYHIELQT